MGSLSDSFVNGAVDIIKKLGRASPVVFTRPTVGEYSPDMLTRPENTATTYSCYAAPINFKLNEIDNTTILTGQKMLWVPSKDINNDDIMPIVGDVVSLETDYRVLEVTRYETESVVCAFLLKIGQ